MAETNTTLFKKKERKPSNTDCHQMGFQTHITSLMSSSAGGPLLCVSVRQQS